MNINKIIGTVLALGLTTFAAAGDVSTDETAVIQNLNAASAVKRTSKIGSRDTAATADNMAGFKAIVIAVLADNDRSDELDDDLADKGHLERHLGLGFAHGMSNKNKPQKGGNKDGKDRDNPHNDDCRGNGHGNNGNGNANGHQQHGNGNGFGHRDCGEPSPSD